MNLEKIKELFIKYKEVILYLIFGFLTTLINIVLYEVFSKLFGIFDLTSKVIAWIFAVLFAYLTNRKWVFQSDKSKSFIEEGISFYTGRLATMIFDMLIFYIFVRLFKFNDTIVNICSNIFVIILNYIISKVFVFKNKIR